MKKEFGNRKGFTIVELLVVIAILSILAGAITMGVNGMFYKSRRSNAIALRNMLQSGLETYYAQKGEWPKPIRSLVNNNEDVVKLSSDAADECFREIVKVSTGVNATPVLDPSGLFVAHVNDHIDDYGCSDVHRSWDNAQKEGALRDRELKDPPAPHKCNGRCPRGRGTFKEVTRKGDKNRISSTRDMIFGYAGPNNGRFCRFRLYYYPKPDTVKVFLQPANEFDRRYSKKYRNGYTDD